MLSDDSVLGLSWALAASTAEEPLLDSIFHEGGRAFSFKHEVKATVISLEK